MLSRLLANAHRPLAAFATPLADRPFAKPLEGSPDLLRLMLPAVAEPAAPTGL
jgi:hypothetical protein